MREQMTKSTMRGLAGGITLLFAIVLMAAGCSRAPNSLTGQETVSGGMATTLEISNPRLQKKVQIDVNVKTRRPGGNLEVSVGLKSRAKRTQKFEYKFLWFDSAGFNVERSEGNWTPFTINGLESKGIQGTAPTPDATSFKMQLRFPQSVSE